MIGYAQSFSFSLHWGHLGNSFKTASHPNNLARGGLGQHLPFACLCVCVFRSDPCIIIRPPPSNISWTVQTAGAQFHLADVFTGRYYRAVPYRPVASRFPWILSLLHERQSHTGNCKQSYKVYTVILPSAFTSFLLAFTSWILHCTWSSLLCREVVYTSKPNNLPNWTDRSIHFIWQHFGFRGGCEWILNMYDDGRATDHICSLHTNRSLSSGWTGTGDPHLHGLHPFNPPFTTHFILKVLQSEN